MAALGWRPAAAAMAAARPGWGGPGRGPGAGPASEPAPGTVPQPAAPATAAVYVHWPYCRKRCSYCNFNKYVVPAVDEAAMRACLVREARTLLRLSQVQSVTSVFFGGGTPSLASPCTVAAVLEAIAGTAHLPAGAEVTLEANPSSASPPRLDGFRAAGINRLSIGVQSLDDAELQLLGREHTAAEARGAVEVARGLFPGRTSIDLIFGLPGQSQSAWARGLEAALGLCDDHVSLYQLTLERGTALAAQVSGGNLPAPPQDLLADMYQTACTMLVAAGFRHYEVSNFARKGALSTHNLSYWRAEQYIGVGPGAHGRFVPWGEGGCSREARVQTLEPDAWMREAGGGAGPGAAHRRGCHTRALGALLPPPQPGGRVRGAGGGGGAAAAGLAGAGWRRPAVPAGGPGPAGLPAARPALPAAARLGPAARHGAPRDTEERTDGGRWGGRAGDGGGCKKEKTRELSSLTIAEEPTPVSCVLQGDDIQALAIKVEDLEKLHVPHPPHDAGRIPVRKEYLVRKYRSKETKKVTDLFVAYPAFPKAPREPLTFSGPELFGDGCEKILPHHILGSLKEFKEEALARGNAQVLNSCVQERDVMEGRITEASSSIRASADGVRLAREVLVLQQCRCSSLITQINPSIVSKCVPVFVPLQSYQLAGLIEVSHQDVTAAALKEEHGGVKKVHQPPPAEHKALQNWHHHMTMRKKQEKHLGEILQRPENELLMNTSEDYRQIQEERDLIDRCLPALLPGKGYRRGSEFWRQPERIGDEVTGLTMTLTQRECGYAEPVTHVGKPRSIQMEMGLKPPKRIPFHLTWHKSLFLKERQQELKSVLKELDFYKPDLDGLEVIGKGQPFTSVSTEPFPPSTPSEESVTLSDSLRDCPSVVPEGVVGPSLDFCGQPARWIDGTTSRRDEIGIAARLTFETLVGEKAESSLMVSNDGTTAIWYDWMRLPQKIPSRETKGIRMPCFYFDIRSGVLLPGETRKFSFIFKSESAGIFSESWEFRTHPLLLGGALLQVTLWGIAVYEDIFADLREKLETDLAAREGAAVVEEYLKKHLVQPPRVRTPERSPSPVDTYVTEEELFHWKNPEFHYQHQVVKRLHELWRWYMTVPSASEEKVPSRQKSTVEDTQHQERTSEALPAQSSTTEVPGVKSMLEEASSGWNLSLDDFKQAIKSIPKEEQREAALAQLNKAALELRRKRRPTQTDLLHQICLQLWRETIDGLVSRSMRLRSLLGVPENTVYVDGVPEETGTSKQQKVKG
ncbi:radical S-adenosyl methionine domain-containing protein 1, mitochondrial isoform X2 [Rissa tridactyla]|uniref:radical S-adenosyl methionine domain-containing protein 1, mitochondrial isoform X2 n=1 Tax=Rissa tridactyla TaxID=75485 RepID=UPI0023BA5E68|nr:radical S-adenosyl methionine domain-containing protein 1, mitochondrial isoform X2 [Rissa tridactyla]